MNDGWLNRAVVSLAGRDRDTVCIVVQEEGEYLFLADGRQRPVERPKKKKRKHARLLTDACGEPIRFDGELLTNRFVRQFIRQTVEGVSSDEGTRNDGRRSYSG